jgi:hypothetical protein
MEIVRFVSFERSISWELYDRFDLAVKESKYSLGPIHEHSRWHFSKKKHSRWLYATTREQSQNAIEY